MQVDDPSRSASNSGGRIHWIANCAWDELTMTWNGQPGISGVLLDTAGVVNRNQIVDFDVTAAITGDGIYCLALDSTSSDGVDYLSREAGVGGPELLIEPACPCGGAEATTTTTTTTTTISTTTTTALPAAAVARVLADVKVEAKNPRENFGTDGALGADADSVKHTFLRVSVSGLDGAPSSAIIRLTVRDARNAQSDSGGRIQRISNCGWDESTVTYGTRPALDGTPGPDAGPVMRGDVVDFDVTPYVTGDGTYCFAITSDSPDGVDYDSREAGATGPLFIVN
jgi:hypothetical protein